MTEWGKVKGRAERGYVMWAKQVPNPIPLSGAASSNSNPQEAREHATKYAAHVVRPLSRWAGGMAVDGGLLW